MTKEQIEFINENFETKGRPGDEEAKLIKVKDMRKYIRKYFTD